MKMSFNEGILFDLDPGLFQLGDGFPSYHHTMNCSAIFQKLRNYCTVLRDDLRAWDLTTLPQAGAQAGGLSDGAPILYESMSASGATP